MTSPEANLPAMDYAHHRVASSDEGTHWYEHAHNECVEASVAPIRARYKPGRGPGIFDVDVYDCELCGQPIGVNPND